MGEYWKPVNIDRGEQLHPHRMGDGLKWRDWVSNSQPNINAEPDPEDGPYDARQSYTRKGVEYLVEHGLWGPDDEVRIVSDYGGSVHLRGKKTARGATYGCAQCGDADCEHSEGWADVHEKVPAELRGREW